ncbi:hypothetical protein LDENG_00232890 [Lucifuga dentata]|nr:hypothetical protein LDENG_00232890 [Lucifuga dentata]
MFSQRQEAGRQPAEVKEADHTSQTLKLKKSTDLDSAVVLVFLLDDVCNIWLYLLYADNEWRCDTMKI